MSFLRSLIAAVLLVLVAMPAHAQEQGGPYSPTVSAELTLEEWKELPDRVRYTPGGPIPPYYEHRVMVRKAAWITGISIFGGVYLTSTLIGVADPQLYPMLIPVVGPWITIANSGGRFTPPGVWALTMNGIAQATGVGLFIWGVTDKQDFLVKKPYGFASLQISPVFGPQFAGGTISGRF